VKPSQKSDTVPPTPLETFVRLHRRPVLLSTRRDTLREDADHVVVELLDFRPFEHKAKPVQVWALLERIVVHEGRSLVLLEVRTSKRKSRGVVVHMIEESHVWASWGAMDGAHPAHAHMLRRVHDGVYIVVGQYDPRAYRTEGTVTDRISDSVLS
jgi:hypothetical protein